MPIVMSSSICQALFRRPTTTTKKTMMVSIKEVLSLSVKGSDKFVFLSLFWNANGNRSVTIFVIFSINPMNFALEISNIHITIFVVECNSPSVELPCEFSETFSKDLSSSVKMNILISQITMSTCINFDH